MEYKISKLKKHVQFLYDELEMKEKEIDEYKKSLDDANEVRRQMSKAVKGDLEDNVNLKKLIEEQKEKIFCLRKHRDQILDKHENTIDDYEVEFKAKEGDIKKLQEVALNQKQQIVDLQEELSTKQMEIEDLRKCLEIRDSKDSSNILSEELKVAEMAMKKRDVEKDNTILRLKVEGLQAVKLARDQENLKYDDAFNGMKND